MIERESSPIDYEFVADCFGPLMSHSCVLLY
jgi:hypothetical protein